MALTFSLPADDDASDGAPSRIEHGIDYMFDDPAGRLMFHYNYLVYHWTLDGGRAVTARAYLDVPHEVSVLDVAPADLPGAEYAAIVRYLQRRFRTIKALQADGYAIVYRAQRSH